MRWTDELIEQEIKSCMKSLDIKRMPTKSELLSLNRNDLHCKISKSKKYTGWAEHLGLQIKRSETTFGNEYEYLIKEKIESFSNHLTAEKMTTKHPYDLLVNGCVKIDVKVGCAHLHFGTRAHTFNLNKKYATCDIYICVALDEKKEIERCFTIPAALIPIVTLNIGKESKYNKYIDRWDFVYHFVNEYEKAINI